MSRHKSTCRSCSFSSPPSPTDHTAKNTTKKAHKNSGLHKKKKERFVSTKGMDPKFLRNQRFAKKHNNKTAEAEA